MSSKLVYLSQFPILLHQYIYDIIDVSDGGNFAFRTIATLLGQGKESWPLIQTRLYTEVYQHHQPYFNLFYDTIPKVRSAWRVDGFGVQGCDNG